MALSHVIAVCGDPGGANAVAPVIQALRADRRVTVQALAYREARELWARRGLEFEELAERMPSAAVADLLRRQNAVLLLTGTSFNSINLENRFIAAAREMRLASLAVLDFWSNYTQRFGDQDGRLVYVPDRIAIMDERAREEMVSAGFDPKRLVITGQPAFDDLAVWRLRFTPMRRQAIRETLKVDLGALLVLFASQPLSLLYGSAPTHPLYPGYDEQKVLRVLVAALDEIAEKRHQEITLVVRPHPREAADAFIEAHGHTTRLIVSVEVEARDMVMAADLVTGMSTVLLMEACYLGCVTVSLQPGLRSPDVLPTNAWEFSRAVYREEDIQPVVERMLFDQEARRSAQARLATFQLDSQATERVVKLAYQMIGLDKA